MSKVERLQRYWPEKRVDFFCCIPIRHCAENVSWILFLHSVESSIVDCALKERSSYSWSGSGGGMVFSVHNDSLRQDGSLL